MSVILGSCLKCPEPAVKLDVRLGGPVCPTHLRPKAVKSDATRIRLYMARKHDKAKAKRGSRSVLLVGGPIAG